jgi:GNAT superfamily N-acetyltransferase
MATIVLAEGGVLDRILDDTFPIWNDGLSRRAYARFYLAQTETAWGRAHLQRFALMEGDDVLASAKAYRFDATLDGRAVQVLGIGAVFTTPSARRRGVAGELLNRLLERAGGEGVDLALLFSEIDPAYYQRLGFEAIQTMDRRLRVIESTRYGAPMTMVRGGDARDYADIVGLGRTRSERYRFHLDRDRDLVHFAIAKKRLLAGFDGSGARAVHFFIAEEGASAVAYVVISVHAGEWTLQEIGDRDPAGARAGALLQALIAREPAEKRPSIRAWLPDGFLPPQVTIVGETPSADVMMLRPLTDRGRPGPPLTGSDVCFWRSDHF